MTEPLQIGQFAIVNNEPVEHGPNAGRFHGKGPVDDHAELIMVAEGTTPAGEAFAGHVVSALGLTFNRLDMSLTGSLRRLFDEAAQNVVDWNRKSIAQHQVSLGLNCFARRGEQAVLAQAGPAVAFHVHAGDVIAYFPDEEHARPIGIGEPNVQLTRLPFVPGDRLLLISTVALQLVDEETMLGILALPGPQALRNLYQLLQDLRHVTTVLITSEERPTVGGSDEIIIGEELPSSASGGVLPHESGGEEPIVGQQDGSFQPSLFVDSRRSELSLEEARRQLFSVVPRRRQIEAAEPVPLYEMPAPLLRVSGDTTLSRLAAERLTHAEMMQAAGAVPYPTLRRPLLSPVEPAAPTHRRRKKKSFSRGLGHGDKRPPVVDPAVESMPRVTEMAAEQRARTVSMTAPAVGDVIADNTAASMTGGGSLVRLRANMGGRWKANGVLSRGRTIGGSLPPTWLVILVGLGLLVTLVGFLTVPGLMEKQNGEHYSQLLNGAQQRLSAAKVEQNPAQQRTDLIEAQAMLIEAQGMNGAGSDVQTFLTQVNQAIATMDAVRAPADVTVLGSLEQFGDKPVSATRLTIGDDDGYVLDSASTQVIAMPLSGGGSPAVVYAADAAKKQGNPVATAFLDATGGAGAELLIVDAANALWAYAPASGLHQIAFGAPAGLHVTDIATYEGALYVLDASQNTVFRFAQTDGAFGQAPTVALHSTDLAAARQLTVGDDIVTSDANGALYRFTGGVALALSQAGIDKKLITPAAPQTLAGDGDIAVLDTPNDRIVALRRDGAFDYQYQSPDFHASTAFAVRDGVGYLFSGGQLKQVTFTK